ncbi:ParB/RepB/Spo0J family partition protein [Sutterella sp.]|uniref:ParB/RepB/Spo0J family partition protein n=1 Tax=Sutterella sp. TaxID=1981025 RepID=UPI0026E0D1E8|nr:ParB/RepB/Spo0J family partition protein [Sutterella sp.]MDO5530442.1 ParB/RepB/Spo0J family partition protein [Sutterella sp.]
MAAAKKKEKGLGRGLDALFAGDLSANVLEEEVRTRRLVEVETDRIRPGRYQPRTRMDENSIAELADSIREQGLLSPILVRETDGDELEVIAGERRLRAAKLAGLETVPVLIEEVDDEHALVIGLIENIQRENLNPIEEAQGLQRLIDEFSFTHEAAAKAIGRSRPATSNLLRLLSLTDEVKDMVMRGELEMGHARALLGLEGAEQVTAAKTVAARGLSVRQTEDLVRRLLEGGQPRKRVVIKTRDNERLEEALAETLGAVVKLTANQKGKGRIVIEFSSLDQLQGIVDHIQKE